MAASTVAPEVAPVPVQPAERIQIVDILRGFALFGILLVNMTIFSAPFQSILFPVPADTPWFDRVALWIIHCLGEGKFYALFSLLFGLGMVLKMERIEGRSGHFGALYARRLLILLAIGMIHAFLIWSGDILIIYALLGFALLLFRKAKPRTLLIWAAGLIIVPLLFMVASFGLVIWARSIPEAARQIDASIALTAADYRTEFERAAQVYATGNIVEVTQQRISDYVSMGLSSLLVLGFNILAMFLVGAAFAKLRLFHHLAAHRQLWRRLLIWGGIIGLIGNAIYATLIMDTARYDPSLPLLIAIVAQGMSAPLLMLAYVSAICLLALQPTWSQRLNALAPLGQMALSNYLLQSIVCTAIFYSYGLALFGKVGAAAGMALTIVIYLLQIPLSHWWKQRFLYGPVEWLWRSFTYRKWQPIWRHV